MADEFLHGEDTFTMLRRSWAKWARCHIDSITRILQRQDDASQILLKILAADASDTQDKNAKKAKLEEPSKTIQDVTKLKEIDQVLSKVAASISNNDDVSKLGT